MTHSSNHLSQLNMNQLISLSKCMWGFAWQLLIAEAIEAQMFT